jgi:hypothetical protein
MNVDSPPQLDIRAAPEFWNRMPLFVGESTHPAGTREQRCSR